MTSGKFMACQLAYKYRSLETSSNPILYIENNKILVPECVPSLRI